MNPLVLSGCWLASRSRKCDNGGNVRPPRSGQTAGGVADCVGVDVNIVHDAPSGVTTSPNFVARMARADSCPEACGNLEVPRSVAPTNNGLRAAYLCSGCGHAWTTDWMEDDA